MNPDIFSYIKSQENDFETEEVQVGDNWSWSFRKHVQMIFHLKNGQFFTGANDWLRAFKNIMEPILKLSYWTEDIEVRDVTFFIEGEEDKALSFLLKKYHDEVYTRKHDLDSLFDEITESDIDYGGVLVQKGVEMPEVLPLVQIAFCDQTDLEGGPVGFKYFFTPDKLRSMGKYGWGKDSNGATISLEDLCRLATFDKEANSMNDKKNKVSGKTIEVYIVRGNLPDSYLNDGGDTEDWYNQIQIVAFYVGKDNKKQGVVLYRKKEEEGNLRFFTSKKVPGRGLGRGDGEAILPDQIWTNFLSIHKMGLLEAASKVTLYTDDESYTAKNKIQDMENLEITTVGDNKRIFQTPTASPTNIQLYEEDIQAWFTHAQFTGSAFDPLMGVESSSGTTFRGQERTVAQGRGPHDRRRGQRAKFIEELYRDFIIPDMVREINKGKKFLASLSTEELTWVADRVSTNLSNQKIKDAILSGRVVTQAEADALRNALKDITVKKGNKQLLESLKGEFDDAEIKIGINIAGKQKDLAQLSDKLLSIFQFIFANPQGFQQAMQVPALSNAFENILEFGGMSIANFSTLLQAPPTPVAQGGIPQPSPLAPLPQQATAF